MTPVDVGPSRAIAMTKLPCLGRKTRDLSRMGPTNSRPKSTHLVRDDGRLLKLGVGVSQEGMSTVVLVSELRHRAPFEGVDAHVGWIGPPRDRDGDGIDLATLIKIGAHLID